MLKVVASVLAVGVGAASAQTWTVTQAEFASVAMAVASPQDNVVVAPIGDNGSGSAVLVSTDGGNTFNQVPAPDAGLYMAGAATGTTAVVGSMFGLQAGKGGPNNYNFTAASVAGGLTSQSIEAFSSGGNSYGATGSTIVGGGNGVAVTTDGGASFNFFNVSELVTSARYGAFPTADTWYLSAGQWADDDDDDDARSAPQAHERAVRLSKRLTLRADDAGNVRLRAEPPARPSAAPRRATSNSTGWVAQIVKTTDAGQSWESVFLAYGGFYFNQISCATALHCAAVGEADGTGGSSPGIRILVTTDGGQTWKQTLFNATPSFSVMAIRAVSDQEWWAAGGDLQQTGIEGLFFHSLDGGMTWATVPVPDAYGVSLAFEKGGKRGYATALNAEQVSSFLVYQ